MMAKFKTLNDLPPLHGKRVLLRADINVPLSDGAITDTSRIDRFLPTLKALQNKGAQVVVMSHMGRPRGRRDPALSLGVVAQHMGLPLVEGVPSQMQPGQAAMLENLRFDPREETNDATFAQELAQTADIYINDAFSVSHRAHASVEAITRYLPSYAGLLMEEELSALERALENPKRPVLALIGGAKVSSKLQILENLSQKVEMLAIGGAMANTFLMAQGFDVGDSMVEPELRDTALRILETASARILMPTDVVVATEITPEAEATVKSISAVGEKELILDIGHQTIENFGQAIAEAHTVVMNGPMGVFEVPPFDQGTNQVFRKIAESKHLSSIAGGGDTVAALKHAGVLEDMGYVSTAGGAFLEWLEGRELAGVEALKG